MALLKSQAKVGNPTLREALEEFIVECRTKNLSPSTAEFYERRVSEFLEPWLEVPLLDVTIHDVRERICYCQERSYSPATINGNLRAVKALFNYALREDYDITLNPKAIRAIKEPKRVMPHLSTEDEIRALLSQPNQQTFLGLRDFTMMLVTLDSGIRVGELVGLDVDDVKLPQLKVRGKGDKERLIRLSDQVQKTMMKYLRARKECGVAGNFLFPSRHGRRISARTFAGHLKEYGEAAGITSITLAPHRLRYTYATHYLRNGGDIVSLQGIMGHTTLTQTRHYAQVTNADFIEHAPKFSPVGKLKL